MLATVTSVAVRLHKGPRVSSTALSTLTMLWLSVLHSLHIMPQPFRGSYTLQRKALGITCIFSITCVPGKNVVMSVACVYTVQNAMKWQCLLNRFSVLTCIYFPVCFILVNITHSVFGTIDKAYVTKVVVECNFNVVAWLRYAGLWKIALPVMCVVFTVILCTVTSSFYFLLSVHLLMTPTTAVMQIVRPPKKYAVIVKMF